MSLLPKTPTPSFQIPVTHGTLTLKGLLGVPCASCPRPGAACGTDWEPAGNIPEGSHWLQQGPRQAWAVLSALLMLAGLGPDRALQPFRAAVSLVALWCFGLDFWVLSFLLVRGSFFPLLQMSFIITQVFSDMEKTFLTSNMLRTVSKHLVFTSFPPPNYFALRNSSLPPPPPPPSLAPALVAVPAPLPVLVLPAPAKLGTGWRCRVSHAFGTVEMSL